MKQHQFKGARQSQSLTGFELTLLWWLVFGVQSVRVVAERTAKRTRTLGFVEFQTISDAQAVLASHQGYVLDLDWPEGPALDLSFAWTPKADRQAPAAQAQGNAHVS